MSKWSLDPVFDSYAFVIASAIVWMYDSKSVKIFETILKLMVGMIVLSFFGVVAVMASKGTLPWNEIFTG